MKLFFVQTVDGSARRGYNYTYGSVLGRLGNGRLLAHEFLHACGLGDIYIAQTNATLLKVEGEVLEHLLPDDWACGYYPEGTMQADVIKRLLMYGDGDYSPSKADMVPYGDIWGLGYKGTGTNQVWSLGPQKVGLKDLNRQPVHQ